MGDLGGRAGARPARDMDTPDPYAIFFQHNFSEVFMPDVPMVAPLEGEILSRFVMYLTRRVLLSLGAIRREDGTWDIGHSEYEVRCADDMWSEMKPLGWRGPKRG